MGTENSQLDTVEHKNFNISKMPVVPIRDMLLFPNTIGPVFIGKVTSVVALTDAIKNEQNVLIIYQSHSSENDDIDSLPTTGTVAKIIQSVKLMDGTIKVVFDGLYRATIDKYYDHDDCIRADVRVYQYSYTPSNVPYEIQAIMRIIVDNLYNYVNASKQVGYEFIRNIMQVQNPDIFSDIVASHINLSLDKKYEILQIINIKARLEKILEIITSEVEIIKLERQIQEKVKNQIDKGQKEYHINEQIKVLRKELGESDSTQDAIDQYEHALTVLNLPSHAKQRVIDEVKKLKSLSSNSSETAIIRSYIDLVLALPWSNNSKLQTNIKMANKILEKSHYGMEKTKQRVIESIAVQIKTKKMNKAVLCLYGPPGVGKTSLAKSIAQATGREYIKISLGGVHDESEIRGHRRTYIGAMPGKIIAAIKRAKTNNPLILLDEIDKLSADSRGDPASALLEVLDPEQNKQFMDHYLDLEYDLSNIFFVATTNSLNISPALLDRMEVIRVPSYLEQEKFVIAKNYLIPKQIKEMEFSKTEFKITDDAIHDIIKYHTREAGTRELERKIATLCRKAVVETLSDKKKITITSNNLKTYLGIKKYTHTQQRQTEVGVVNGLAYTEFGGDILFIEAVLIPNGKGEIRSTGKLGDVMKESVQIAYSFCKSNAKTLGIDIEDINKHDVHLHVPEGATPKDGPSAGITIVMAITSIFTGKVCSNTIAMTGEVSLKGDVMAIGGLREKLTSAVRSGIKTIIIPADNAKDLEEVPSYITDQLEIKTYSKAIDVVRENLTVV